MFAVLKLSEASRGITLKCDPELAIELREQHPEVTPAYHFNKIIISFQNTVDGIKL
jgi:predicted DNA-binding protein (MmcQ/YjbR family)